MASCKSRSRVRSCSSAVKGRKAGGPRTERICLFLAFSAQLRDPPHTPPGSHLEPSGSARAGRADRRCAGRHGFDATPRPCWEQ
jgi:hypothetical protein